ncbi:uncharacterized protein LOC132560312 [Ylistrum balloti]|uniref:uncharacterized protein LOC132560312 n=1 Tax=Ylistrum balloti TaxID=509963 RepID=UPI002905F00C|nr:uncharacterized protein LOC132560312 [Ylistrum balloti]
MKVCCILSWTVLIVTILCGQCCLVDRKWSSKSIYDLLDMADIVVYGRDIAHVERTGVSISSSKVNNVTDCQFKVFCVLKGNTTMEYITIERISPLTACSGSREKLQIGMEKIVALKMTKSGNYKYFEGNALQSSVYDNNAENFRTMSSVSEIGNWRTPIGAKEDTCQSAMETFTVTAANSTENTIDETTLAKNSSELPEYNTTKPNTQANDQSTATETNTVKPTTEVKEADAKIAANMQQRDSTEAIALLRHLLLFPLLAMTVFN